MKPEELRIGNWYKAPLELIGSNEAIIDMTKDRHFVMTKEAKHILLRLDKLIPIITGIEHTEENIRKIGFIDDKEKECWSLDDAILLNYDFVLMDTDMHVVCFYVHEVQDLIMALSI